MNKYHSTISRRDFLKALGLGGIGIGAAAVAPPAVRDLDELTASPMSIMKRPSWVKEVAKPTIEIDWSIMKRFDYNEVMWAGGFQKAWGKENADLIIKASAGNLALWRSQNKPGYTLADAALNGCTNQTPLSFMGPQSSATPGTLGVPRWEGKPEEAARLVRAFMRLHGAYHVGFVELDTDTTEKLIMSYDAGKVLGSGQGPRLDILDVDQPVDAPADPKTGAGGYRIIPKKARWAIVYSLRMSPELIHRAPSLICAREHGYMYDLRTMIQGQTQNFLRTLGYMGLSDTLPFAAFCQSTGFAVMAGLGETCRAMHTITPEFGMMQRIFVILTDLPLAPGKPVDFGVTKFCRVCKKCSDYCPAHAIETATEPSWQVKGPYNRPGVKHWYRLEPLCRAYIYQAGACAICLGVCPYSKIHNAAYTNTWQRLVATTPVLDRAVRKMDDFMGYGLRTGDNIEKFWELELPPFGWT